MLELVELSSALYVPELPASTTLSMSKHSASETRGLSTPDPISADLFFRLRQNSVSESGTSRSSPPHALAIPLKKGVQLLQL